MTVNSEQLVAIARVVKPKGLRGEVAAEVLTDFPERFENLADVFAVMPDGSKRKLKVEDRRFHQQRILFKFAGVDTIDAAELLRNSEICVDEADAVKLGEGEFYDWQLIGCAVETCDGEQIGEVRDIMRTGGTEILVVDGKDRERLIPFAESICTDVEIDEKRIRINPPDGLLDF